MNFGPFPPMPDAPLAPADWYISFASEVHQQLMTTTASLSRGEHVFCRLTHAGSIGPDEVARGMLVRKARMWVRDYQLRKRTGLTGFGTPPT